MYLRETRRTNRDGSVVRYLQLAHNERHPETGNSVAKVIHNFGRAERVDRQALARLVLSISRFLTPEQAITAREALDAYTRGSARAAGLERDVGALEPGQWADLVIWSPDVRLDDPATLWRGAADVVLVAGRVRYRRD